MHAFVRRALAEDNSSSTIPDPNLLFLIFKAIAIWVLTASASESSVHVWNALSVYDSLIADAKSPEESDVVKSPATDTPASRKKSLVLVHAIIFSATVLIDILFFLAIYNGWVSERMINIFSDIASFCAAVFGFKSLTEHFYTLDVKRVARGSGQFVPSVKPAIMEKKKRAILRAPIALLALYTTFYPNRYLVLLAIMGLAYRIIRVPVFPFVLTTIRGLVFSGIIGIPALLITIFGMAVMLQTATSTASSVGSAANAVDLTTSSQSLDTSLIAIYWAKVIVQLSGIYAGILTAMVLRYESGVGAKMSPKSAHILASVVEEGGLQAHSNVLVIANRTGSTVFPPNSFINVQVALSEVKSTPLYSLCLFTTFSVHLPAMFLNTGVGTRLAEKLADTTPTTKTISYLVYVLAGINQTPAELWAFFFMPFVVGCAILIRKDRREIWKYAESWVINVEPTKANTVVKPNVPSTDESGSLVAAKA